MKDFLRKAFVLAATSCEKISQTYDQIGFWTMRLLMDDQFLSISKKDIQSPTARKATDFYEWGKGNAQQALFSHYYKTGTTSDVGPKPDIKPGLFKAAQSLALYLPKMGITPQSALMALGAATAIVATYLLYQAGTPTTMQDLKAMIPESKHEDHDYAEYAFAGGVSMPYAQPSIS